jgi:hypothetical protein
VIPCAQGSSFSGSTMVSRRPRIAAVSGSKMYSTRLPGRCSP